LRAARHLGADRVDLGKNSVQVAHAGLLDSLCVAK
jgi:hypothetical protein